MSLSQAELLSGALKVLKNPVSNRTKEQNYALLLYLRTINYFQEKYNEICEESQKKLCEPPLFDEFLADIGCGLEYQNFPKGSLIFHKGDTGDKMYILLKGKINIYIPKNLEELDQDKAKIQLNVQEIASPLKRRNSFLVEIDPALNISPDIIKNLSFYSTSITDDQYLLLGIGRLNQYYEEGVFKFKKIITLESGAIFGEVALQKDAPRAATILAKEHIEVATMSRNVFKKIFSSALERDKEKERFFREMFPSIQTATLTKFAYEFIEKKYPTNCPLFYQHEPVKEIFLIKKGSVEIYRHVIDQEGKLKEEYLGRNSCYNKPYKPPTKLNQRLAVIEKNEFVGAEDALFNRAVRSYSARSLASDTVVYAINVQKFEIIHSFFFLKEILLNKLKLKEKWLQERMSDLVTVHKSILEQSPVKIFSESAIDSKEQLPSISDQNVLHTNKKNYRELLPRLQKIGILKKHYSEPTLIKNQSASIHSESLKASQLPETVKILKELESHQQHLAMSFSKDSNLNSTKHFNRIYLKDYQKKDSEYHKNLLQKTNIFEKIHKDRTYTKCDRLQRIDAFMEELKSKKQHKNLNNEQVPPLSLKTTQIIPINSNQISPPRWRRNKCMTDRVDKIGQKFEGTFFAKKIETEYFDTSLLTGANETLVLSSPKKSSSVAPTTVKFDRFPASQIKIQVKNKTQKKNSIASINLLNESETSIIHSPTLRGNKERSSLEKILFQDTSTNYDIQSKRASSITIPNNQYISKSKLIESKHNMFRNAPNSKDFLFRYK